MPENSTDLMQQYLRRAFINNSYNSSSTHMSLRKTFDNSFSYLYSLQNSYIEYEEHFIDIKKADENIRELNRLYFNKSYKPCFDIDKNLINICNYEAYRGSRYYKQKISFDDIVKNPDIFLKIPVVIIDDHTIWDYQLLLTDDYSTFILSLPSNFVFEYERSNNTDKRVYKEHKVRIMIIENIFYQRIRINHNTNPSVFLNNSTKTLTIKKSLLKSIPANVGILFGSFHIPNKGKDYELGSMLIDFHISENDIYVDLTDDLLNLLSDTKETYYLSLCFFNKLKRYISYEGHSYISSDGNEVNLVVLEKNSLTLNSTPYDMPIPIENCIIMKQQHGKSGYELIHNSDSIELFYPNIYHIIDDHKKGDKYKLFYFYHEGYNLKYTCIHDFYFYYLKNKFKTSTFASIIDLIYRNKINLSNMNESQQKEFKETFLYILRYYSYIHKYGDIDFIYQYNQGNQNIKSIESFKYKNETLRDWMKKEPFVLRDYVYEQKNKGSSFYIFTNTLDLNSRLRNDISTEFPDDDTPTTFDEPHYVFSTINNNDFDNNLNIRVFVDGLFVINLYQKKKQFTEYIYIPSSLVSDDSFIEVEYVKPFYFDKEVTFNSLTDKKEFIINCQDKSLIPTLADTVCFNNDEDDIHTRYDINFFNINIKNEYGEFKTSNGTENHPLRFVNMTKFTLTPNSEVVINKPLRIRLSKLDEGIKYIVPHDGEIFLEFVDNNFGYHKDFIRVYQNGRLMPRQKYMFYPMYYYPRIRFLDEMKKGDILYIDVSPYRYTQIYYQEDISPSNDIFDLKNIIKKPFDIKYYDVYLNGRKLSLNNIITIDPWTIKFLNLHSIYNLLIFEKERDDEYYAVTYTEDQFYFSVEELFKKSFITEDEKTKILDFIIENRKEKDLIIHPNTNEEKKEDYTPISGKYIYFLFDSYYYDELMPKTFMNPDIQQVSLIVMIEWFKEIYDLYHAKPFSCDDEENAMIRRQKYIDAICLDPDKFFDGDNTDNSQIVYAVGHLNEIPNDILNQEVTIKKEVTIDKYIKDELESDENWEV